MGRAVVFQHVESEGPGRIADVLTSKGYELRTVALHSGEPVPKDVAKDDVVVLMGGPMSVGDVKEHPFLVQELELLRQRIRDDAPTLGVCLGAQLLAKAAGAEVYPMTAERGFERRYELGWDPVSFHPIKMFGLLTGIPIEVPVLHWHGDTFDLPDGARLLASTALCRNQAFQLKHRLFGLQFHCEVTLADVERMARDDRGFIEKANGPGGVERLIAEAGQHMEAFRTVGDRLIGNIVQAMVG